MASNPMWNAILKWSLAQHDVEGNTDIKPMSQEDKDWLNKVMDSMVINETEQMRLQIEIIKVPEDFEQMKVMYEQADLRDILLGKDKTTDAPSQKSSDEEEKTMEGLEDEVLKKKEESLEYLDDLVQSIDNALDLHKIGGLVVVINALKSKYPTLRWRVAQVVASVVQNNPKCQDWAVELNALPLLLELLKTNLNVPSPTKDELNAVTKSVFALSSLIRNHENATKAFAESEGPKMLLDIVLTPTSTIRNKRKALFLLQHLLEQALEPESKVKILYELVCAVDPLPCLMNTIGCDDCDMRETGLKVMNLIASEKKGREMCLKSFSVADGESEGGEKLTEMLARRLNLIKNVGDPEEKEMHEEEIELIKEVLQTILSPK